MPDARAAVASRTGRWRAHAPRAMRPRLCGVGFVSAALFETLPRFRRVAAEVQTPIPRPVYASTNDQLADFWPTRNLDLLGFVAPPFDAPARLQRRRSQTNRSSRPCRRPLPIWLKLQSLWRRSATASRCVFPRDDGPALFNTIVCDVSARKVWRRKSLIKPLRACWRHWRWSPPRWKYYIVPAAISRNLPINGVSYRALPKIESAQLRRLCARAYAFICEQQRGAR